MKWNEAMAAKWFQNEHKIHFMLIRLPHTALDVVVMSQACIWFSGAGNNRCDGRSRIFHPHAPTRHAVHIVPSLDWSVRIAARICAGFHRTGHKFNRRAATKRIEGHASKFAKSLTFGLPVAADGIRNKIYFACGPIVAEGTRDRPNPSAAAVRAVAPIQDQRAISFSFFPTSSRSKRLCELTG